MKLKHFLLSACGTEVLHQQAILPRRFICFPFCARKREESGIGNGKFTWSVFSIGVPTGHDREMPYFPLPLSSLLGKDDLRVTSNPVSLNRVGSRRALERKLIMTKKMSYWDVPWRHECGPDDNLISCCVLTTANGFLSGSAEAAGPYTSGTLEGRSFVAIYITDETEDDPRGGDWGTQEAAPRPWPVLARKTDDVLGDASGCNVPWKDANSSRKQVIVFTQTESTKNCSDSSSFWLNAPGCV